MSKASRPIYTRAISEAAELSVHPSVLSICAALISDMYGLPTANVIGDIRKHWKYIARERRAQPAFNDPQPHDVFPVAYACGCGVSMRAPLPQTWKLVDNEWHCADCVRALSVPTRPKIAATRADVGDVE